jgi:demethylmacrocin O-methyltransferase
MDMVKDLVDGLNHEELLVEGHEPSYTDTHVRAVHCYHNLVVIEKGDNREGTNKDTSAGHFHGSSPDPALAAASNPAGSSEDAAEETP